MNLDFGAILERLGPNFAFDIANQVRPPVRYVWNRFLPEVLRTTYTVENGYMSVTPTMAGLSGMDSDYNPTGFATLTTFIERTAKVTSTSLFPEKMLRELHNLLQQLGNDPAGNDAAVQAVLNFTSLIVVQGHRDTFEWMRGQALMTGNLNWTFNGIAVAVNYGLPAAHLLTTRTVASNDAYGGTTSKWWDDYRSAVRLLRYAVQDVVMHPDTFDDIVGNDVNKIALDELGPQRFRMRRLRGDNEREVGDFRDVATVTLYAEEGEILDDTVTPTATEAVSFCTPGKVVYIGSPGQSGFRISGLGATDDPDLSRAVGFTHIGPTVEGGRPGRWARVYTPENRPMQLRGDGVTNGLPVIENPKKIVVATTELQP